MILPGCTLFPGGLLPLHIFEQRYREMLADALESDRIFALAEPDPNAGTHPIGSAGIIRACVTSEDGTSQLVLQGVARVEFVSWLANTTYPHADVRIVPSDCSDDNLATSLRRDIIAKCDSFQESGGGLPDEFCAFLRADADHSAFSDVVADTFVRDVGVRRRLLGELDTTRRLEILSAYLARLRPA
jgi:Lon protease-like protein